MAEVRDYNTDDDVEHTLMRVDLARDYPGLMKVRYRLNDGSIDLPGLNKDAERFSIQPTELALD